MLLPAALLPILKVALPFLAGTAGAGASMSIGAKNRRSQEKTNEQNIAAQHQINSQNIDFTRETNELGRQWALEDFDRTNAYNHPTQQMQRFKEAGLNPHLIYGGGSASNLATTIKTPNPNTPSLGVPNAQAPMLTGVNTDFGGIVADAMRVHTMDLQNDNIQAQNILLNDKHLENQMDLAGKAINNAQSQFDFDKSKALYDSSLEAALLKNESLKQGIQTSEQNREMQKMDMVIKQSELALKTANSKAQIANITADTFRKTWENMNLKSQQLAKLKQELSNSEKQGKLMDYEIALRSKGLNPSDPTYARVLVQLATQLAKKYGVDLTDLEP